jgi:cyanophycinase
MRGPFVLLLAMSFYGAPAAKAQRPPIAIDSAQVTRHGPPKGALIIIGGGVVTADIWARFTELAGGAAKANFVVITTAAGDSAGYSTNSVEEVKRATGIQNVVLLHTNDFNVANTEAFIAPVNKATGVFFIGGRQWRLADAYLNTRTHRALLDLLARGGVIAGSSAGASIQGSFLWRGDTKGPHITVGDHTQGLAGRPAI